MSHTIPEPAAVPDETPTLAARHRVTFAVGATVDDLRKALRRMSGADKIVDCWLANAAGEVSLEGLSAIEITVAVTA